MIINLFAAKHGVGTTTTAAMIAASLRTALLVAHDIADAAAVLGMPQPDPLEDHSLDHGTINMWPDEVQLRSLDTEAVPYSMINAIDELSIDAVLDWGTTTPFNTKGTNVLVVDNSYLSLRRSVMIPRAEYDDVVCVFHQGNALQLNDVEHALGSSAIVLSYDPLIARAVDAGLMLSRTPSSAHAMVHHLTAKESAA